MADKPPVPFPWDAQTKVGPSKTKIGSKRKYVTHLGMLILQAGPKLALSQHDSCKLSEDHAT